MATEDPIEQPVRKQDAGKGDDLYVRVRGRYARLLSGDLKVEDLEDEELARGRLKDRNGGWSGRPPVMVPSALVAAMRREFHSRAEDKLREALMERGIGTLVELAGPDNPDSSVRFRAANTLIERLMGKTPDKVIMAAEDPVEAMFRNVLNKATGGLLDSGEAPYEPSFDEREMLS